MSKLDRAAEMERILALRICALCRAGYSVMYAEVGHKQHVICTMLQHRNKDTRQALALELLLSRQQTSTVSTCPHTFSTEKHLFEMGLQATEGINLAKVKQP